MGPGVLYCVISKLKLYSKNNYQKPFIVYQKGDIVKDPMQSIPFLPKIVPGVVVGWGWGRVGHARVGGVGHAGGGVGVGCGRVDHARVGWGGSCKGGVGWW